eukprot:TRINITY_DN33_c0_g3_i1.p1 TRINITY_DN33_c0_g3~~TRINITY_DN33_c0_g3_i1.p1  ORF type:complete len:375 (+),score=85.22 TRINITY_DN33_c0_g3_i1:114-1238(+)
MPEMWIKDDLFRTSLLNKDLLSAAKKGDYETLKGIMTAGANPSFSNIHGETAFYLAASAGHVKCLRLLQAHGVDPLTTTCGGRNALHAAIAENRLEVIKYLLAGNFGNFDVITADGFSCVDLACTYGSIETLKYLLENGFQVNQPTQVSSLHWAVMRGNLQLIKLLLQFKANKNTKSNGVTALHLALDNHGLCAGNDKKALMKLSARLEIIRFLVCQRCKLSCKNCKQTETVCKCVNKDLLGYCRDMKKKLKEALAAKGCAQKAVPTTTTPVAPSTPTLAPAPVSTQPQPQPEATQPSATIPVSIPTTIPSLVAPVQKPTKPILIVNRKQLDCNIGSFPPFSMPSKHLSTSPLSKNIKSSVLTSRGSLICTPTN